MSLTCHSQSSQVTLTYSDTVDKICVQFLLVVALVCTDSSIGGGDGLMVLSVCEGLVVFWVVNW